MNDHPALRFTRRHERLLARIPGTPQRKRLRKLNAFYSHWWNEGGRDSTARAVTDAYLFGASYVKRGWRV